MSVFSFGLGVNGALGQGKITSDTSPTPQKINYFNDIDKRVKKIACGSYHTAFVTDDEQLYICGIKKDPKHNTTLFYTSPNNNTTTTTTTTTTTSTNIKNNEESLDGANTNTTVVIDKVENNNDTTTSTTSTTTTTTSTNVIPKPSNTGKKRPLKLDRGIPHNISARELMQRPESPLLNKLLTSKMEQELSSSKKDGENKKDDQDESNEDDSDDDDDDYCYNNSESMSLNSDDSLRIHQKDVENITKNIKLINDQDSNNNNNNNNNIDDNDEENNKQQQQQQQQQAIQQQTIEISIEEDDNPNIYSIPIKISTHFLENSPLNNIKQVALGNYHIVLLTESGNVWTWGSNSNGQLGYAIDPLQPLQSIAQQAANQSQHTCQPRMVEIKCVKYITTGVKNTAALTEWGELYMWGINENGELGLGDTIDRRTPTRVIRLKNEVVTAIACSSTHSACYTESGKMYLWGQCDEPGKIQTIPTALPIHSYLDRESKSTPGVYGGGGKIKQLACGQRMVAALTQMGEVFMWDVSGTPVPLRNVLENHSVRNIVCGNFHLVCLTDSGEVVTIGRNKTGQLGRSDSQEIGIVKELSFDPEGLNSDEFVVAIGAGEFHTVALVENTPKTKLALQLVRMQRNYLRQLNILNNIYYKSMMSMASPYDPVVLSMMMSNGSSTNTLPPTLKGISGGIPDTVSNGVSNGGGGTIKHHNHHHHHQDSSIGTISGGSGGSNGISPSLLGNGGTLKSRSASIATIRGLFGIPNNMLNHSNSQNFQEENSTVTEDEIKEIFSDIEALSRLTERFLSCLDQRMDNFDPISKVLGDIFLDESLLSAYRIYIPYSDSYNTSCMNLFNIRRRNERLSNIIKDCEKKSKCYGIKLDQEFVKEIDLKSLLLSPLQNIPRIYILLRELASDNINSRDVESINFAATKFQVLLERMNQNFQFVNAVEILHCSSNEYGNPQIMGGSLPQLVDKLTHHNISDPNFRDVFLLTFRAFTTPCNLLDLLVETFQRQKHLKNGRVVNVITSWVVHHFYDFEKDKLSDFVQDPNHNPLALSEKLEQFIENEDHQSVSQIKLQYYSHRKRIASSINLTGNQKPSSNEIINITASISSTTFTTSPQASISAQIPTSNSLSEITSSPTVNNNNNNVTSTTTTTTTTSNNTSNSLNSSSTIIKPTPIPLTVPVGFNLLDYPAIEVAQTLTLLDHHYFSLIDKREFLGQKWTKNKSPNIQNSTDHFNRTSQVAITEILKFKNSKQRSSALAYFINIAYSCFEINNLSGTASIIYGLNSSPIQRLKKTWNKLPKESMSAFEYLDKIVTPLKNYISLRQIMTTIQPPCVPFLGTYLKDLTFIEEGNPSVIGGLINFYKQRKIAEVIFQIQQHQQVIYSSIRSNPSIKAFLLSSTTFDDKQAQKISTEFE